VTADPDARPSSLRSHLRELQAALDEAAAASLAHRQSHGCRGGSGCAEGLVLAEATARAQQQLQMTRFLNEEG
jgi:hypothetical protein